MSIIEKSDLNYEYSWKAVSGDDPTITGTPDSTRFSRKEGYEVLYLINKLCDLWKLKKLASAHKMERMINEDLPSDIQSQEKVKAWIHSNW
ncbi:MAG: hypothetical protein ABJG42_15180 [Vibrio splendidus]